MELRYYFDLFKRWAWLLILGLVIGGAGAYIASGYQPAFYQTSTKFMVMRTPEDRNSDYAALNDFQLARTYSQLIVTEPVLQVAGEKLGFPVHAWQISVRQVTDSLIMILTVEDQHPDRAVSIANTLVGAFIEYTESMQASRFASSEETLAAQITQVEQQIASLQDEMAQVSEQVLKTQQDQVLEQVANLEGATAELQKEIAALDLAPEDPRRRALLAEKQAQLNQLQATLNLFQQVYLNLFILGDSNNTATKDLHFNQLQTTLALYQQIYSNLLNNYEGVRLARLRSTPNIVQIEQARLPVKPVSPQPVRNAALGASLGILIMGTIAFLIEYLDDTLKSPDEVMRQLGLPVLGIIARYRSNEEGPVTLVQPRSPTAEAFRSLRTNIQFASPDRVVRTLLVTSPSPEDGKSTVGTNLAVALAQSERKVLLLDADLRRPKLHELLGLHNREGLSNLFLELQANPDRELHADRYLQGIGIPNLSILTTGSLPPNPAELLGSEKMQKVMQAFTELADIVVIDTPPVLAVTDASVLAPHVDGVVLVVKPGVTRLAACKQAVEQLRRVGANLLGVVFNDVDFRRLNSAFYHYKGYDYCYSHQDNEPGMVKHNNGKVPKKEKTALLSRAAALSRRCSAPADMRPAGRRRPNLQAETRGGLGWNRALKKS